MRLIFDTIIVFICLIGAVEIKSYGCDVDNYEFEDAIQEFNRRQELQGNELEEIYKLQKLTAQSQSIQIATTSPPFHAQRISFFETLQNIPDRNFVMLYCSVATVLAADGLLSMRMAGYLHDTSLFSIGIFEFISGACLLAIPFLAFQLKDYR